ncbi:bifunctional 3,4-dihydroxy-2-butanone-4-phosphate synthase/GTP cyclohydrolase II [Salinibius halmophilus]|uniref:bifunctional 3,4-dihydroxy-2-butanone-4-phosphate synthase/GTP cyclohydrolase II n=1 Tax=Salinibius halmophilus TaxID=1853216 RepID=UPI000E67147D|nr:bifunctional 3,4-dihydroxy-2-butanone-4-phosphate synthase/GTP cyclohydrolase II [Salinibius halmophilus]
MDLNSIEELIADIQQGKMVILMDDEDRENEGDLVMAAQFATPEAINFMAKEARGLICMPMTAERCDYLGLPMMTAANNTVYETAFTVSIEAAEGVTTGISAADRAHTVRTAIDPKSKPSDIVQPGHVFPLRAQPGGVLARAGHTEAGCDIAMMAGCLPAAVIVEIMNEDGTMARRPDLEKFAEQHQLKIGTIADLIEYRMNNEHTVAREEQGMVQTAFGDMQLNVYRDSVRNGTHIALVKGEPTPDKPTTVRVHVAKTLRDLLHINPGQQASWPLQQALENIANDEAGVLLLLDADQPLDLQSELNAIFGEKQRAKNTATHGSYTQIGTGAQMLRDLGVGKMKLLSSPLRFAGLSGFGLEVVENQAHPTTD